MCGIVAVLRKRTERAIPATDVVNVLVEACGAVLESEAVSEAERVSLLATQLGELNLTISGEAGLKFMLANLDTVAQIRGMCDRVLLFVDELGAELASGRLRPDDLEQFNQHLAILKDNLWAVANDRLTCLQVIRDLTQTAVAECSTCWWLSIYQALATIDRLEVRGRDSAGIQIMVSGHNIDLNQREIAAMIKARSSDINYTSSSIRVADDVVSLVYKASAEIGELGDNTAKIRSEIAADELLRRLLDSPTSYVNVLSHTRWASIGIISEPNAHPVSSDEVGVESDVFVSAVLNGDVDNFTDIIKDFGLSIPVEVTTDAKVIPTSAARAYSENPDFAEAFRSQLATYEGSVAIGVSTSARPDELFLALRGSGQGVYIGVGEDVTIAASEPYGVVEDSSTYLRLDGEGRSNPENPASQGQFVRLSGNMAGDKSSVARYSYDGRQLPVAPEEWQLPEVTTRDIDRGDSPHFLLKEISEAPSSFIKTLRGRISEDANGLSVTLGEETMSEEMAQFCGSGLKRVEVIGQGTAAVAGAAISRAIDDALTNTGILVRSIVATELSGFELREDMADTLIVAVSQSGTTTDTNRTVDIVRNRGAKVISIVNRRGSDLASKSDGVLYTSDGRDVEMSVASTKAFYSQIAAGFVLAEGLRFAVTAIPPDDTRQQLLLGLLELPKTLNEVLAERDRIGTIASKVAPSKRYWATVGSGYNSIAAEEIRIKLSELCYKSIACDITEDKKHIDLSSEPLILVCAAGLTGSNADDIAKEVAIFSSHKASPVVIVTKGETRFSNSSDVIAVPECHERLSFILSAMVGHLFGYEAALAIDASAIPLRQIRGSIEEAIKSPESQWLVQLADLAKVPSAKFFELLRMGHYNGHLEAATADRVGSLLRYGIRRLPLDNYQSEFGKVGTPSVVVEDLGFALTTAIDELTRPIDAIKHQAKTVTVGISRSDDNLLASQLVQDILATGCARDSLSYRTLRLLQAVSPAISNVIGYTRYAVEFNEGGSAILTVQDKGGVAASLVSRVETDPTLRGTKRRVATERLPIVTVGTDGRVVLIVPEVKDDETRGLTLCHLELVDSLGKFESKAVLEGYRDRYRQLVDVVTETQSEFDDSKLAGVLPVSLLTDPISEVAKNWE